MVYRCNCNDLPTDMEQRIACTTMMNPNNIQGDVTGRWVVCKETGVPLHVCTSDWHMGPVVIKDFQYVWDWIGEYRRRPWQVAEEDR